MIRSTTIAIVIALVMAVSGCGGGSSTQVQPPPPTVPTINLITPGAVGAGSADLKITLTGSNFLGQSHNFSQAAWSVNGIITLLATTFVSSSQLTAVVPGALLTNPVNALMFLETGDPMGDLPLSKSNSVSFSVSGPDTLSISSLSPTSVSTGSPDLTLTIAGSGFDIVHPGPHGTSTGVFWSVNGSFLVTQVLSDTQLAAVIPASLLIKPVVAQVSVQKFYFLDDTPFLVSNSLSFTVTAPSSTSLSIAPLSATLGLKGTRQFQATGPASSGVNWTVQEGESGGSITSDGLYKAPGDTGVFHITATSTADSSVGATAQITVVSSGFTAAGSMHVARRGHTATLLKGGKVLIVGGGDGTAELFDPTSGTFALTGPPVTGRLGATATLLADGKVLIAGGLGVTAGPDGFLIRLNSAEIFDPAAGTFTATGSMIQARRLHTATLLEDGRVLVAGGYFDTICSTASAELFDPATGTFSSTGFMLTERVNHTATLLKSGEVLMAGGSNGCAPDAADDPPWDPLFVELFEPEPGNFLAGSDMSTTRIGHAAVRLMDGKVLMLGGILAVQNIHELLPNPSYAEEYDSATHTISPVAGLTISQAKYTATLLTSGKVLIAGGVDEDGHPTFEAGLVDPATGTISTTGDLVTARVGHTATLLNDGRVLLTGGTDSTGNATATGELYK